MLKVWGRPNSVNVQKVMWTIAELGIEAERIDAGMQHGVVSETWFGDINPNRLVPTINDEGFILWESNAIVRYLAAKYAAGTLMPDSQSARFEAEMWMDWQQTAIMPGLGPVFLGLVRTPEMERDPSSIETGRRHVEAQMRILDAQLAGKKFVIGETFTMADIPLGCATHRWYALDIERPGLANLETWYARLQEREGFAGHVMLPLS